MSGQNPIVDLMANLRRSVEESAAEREDRRPFIQPVLDREAHEELRAEDRAAQRRVGGEW